MNSAINELARSLTGSATPGDCNLELLQQLAAQNPSFGPAQVLLAAKLKAELSAEAKKQEEHSSLYFINPLWQQQVLHASSQPAANAHSETITTDELIPVATELELPTTNEELVVQTPTEEITHRQQTALTTDIPEDEDESEPIIDSEPAFDLPPMKMPELKIEPIDPATAELSFEPYHTVDYFASQGIKFREEDKPKDVFSAQLKSFTEWLKTMKRLPVSEIAASTSPTEERKVEQMAQHSISDQKVITEAMAEVWIKQGDNAKAAEVYQKLSLLDPAKSSYFAAKIDQLKHS